MEIPAATIHRLRSCIREAASAPSPSASPAFDAAPAPPFPSFADAVAAFGDSDASSASSGLLCVRCGAAGGLLRGAQSAVCAYCGSRRQEEADGIDFRSGAAYRWLLGSLGLDGSELVEFDGDSTNSNKSKEAPNSGMVLSDLLDLKLTSSPGDTEISGSSKSNEQPSAACTLNLPGVNLDSFFIERKEETAAVAAALPRIHNVVQGKQSTNSRSHEPSSSEMHVTSKGFDSSGIKAGLQSRNQMEVTAAFANWDADFQSTGSESVVVDSKQLDLFKSASVAESSNSPDSGAAITPVVAAESNMKSTSLEQSKDLASASATLNKDNLPAIVESNTGVVVENSAAELTVSPLNKNPVQSNQLPGRDDAGVSIDEAFDDWQDFTGGGNQGTLSNVGEHTDGPLASYPSEIKRIDSWPVSSMASTNNVAGVSSDDWQAFASSSGQGGGDLMKLVEGSKSGQGGGGDLVNPAGETSISLEHSSEANSFDLWPVGNIKEHNTTEIVKQTEDSFDDWQDFTTSGQAQGASFSQAEDTTEVSHVSHGETDVDSWFTATSRESKNTDLVNENNVMLDDWQGFAGSGQAQQSLSNVGAELMGTSFEQHDGTGSLQSWAKASSKETSNTVSTNIEGNAFDIWQGLTTSGQQQGNLSNLGIEMTSVSSEPAKQIDSMDLWLTSSVKESKSSSNGVSRIDNSPDEWQDFGSFSQAHGNTKNSVEGQFHKDPAGTESVDLWSSSHTEEFKNLEQINESNDLFDDWQDFKSSRQLETSLQDLPQASLSDSSSALRPDILGLEFGSFAESAPSQSQIDKKGTSGEANAVPSDEQLERTNGMQQMGDVDALSAIRATTSHDNYSIPKSEPVNANVEKLLSQMHDLSFMLKDELSVPDKHVDHSKS